MHDVDLGLLGIRLALGLMLIAHGMNKVLGSGGLAGTARWFEGLGLRPGWLHARLAAASELSAGVLMAAGLLVPLAGAAFVGLMVVAARTDHKGKGFFVFQGGWEYVGLVGVVAACLVLIGPGEWSLDHAFGWSLAGLGYAATSVAVGCVAALGLLAVARRPGPQVLTANR